MRRLRWPLGCLIIAALLAVLLVYGVRTVGEAGSQTHCQGRFNQMCHALFMYHQVHGHLPPAYIVGPDGKPWHSWRVLILPYMEGQKVYDQYRFDEPWDGPNNRLLADKIYLKIFQCTRVPGYGTGLHTNIVAIVGDGTAFPGAESTRLSDLRDGGRHTILLAEYRNTDIHWMEPRDLDAGTMSFHFDDPAVPSVSSPHSAGPAVVFADGIKAYRLRRPLSGDTLRALTRIKGDPRVRRDNLEHWDKWNGASLSE